MHYAVCDPNYTTLELRDCERQSTKHILFNCVGEQHLLQSARGQSSFSLHALTPTLCHCLLLSVYSIFSPHTL